MRVYADNAATTAMSKTAIEAMLPYFDKVYGNPSSLHSVGQEAKEALDAARATVAACLGCEPREIIFTSGGSEADNQAIISAARMGAKKGKKHIISTAFEHHAVLHTLQRLEKDVLTANPDLVVVCFGLNDSGAGPDGLQRYSDAVRGILRRLRTEGIDAILMTPNMMCSRVDHRITDELERRIAAGIVPVQTEGVLDAYVEAARAAAAADMAAEDASLHLVTVVAVGIDLTLGCAAGSAGLRCGAGRVAPVMAYGSSFCCVALGTGLGCCASCVRPSMAEGRCFCVCVTVVTSRTSVSCITTCGTSVFDNGCFRFIRSVSKFCSLAVTVV